MAEVLSAVFEMDYIGGTVAVPAGFTFGTAPSCGYSVGEEVPAPGRSAVLVRVWAEAGPMATLKTWPGCLWLCDVVEEAA